MILSCGDGDIYIWDAETGNKNLILNNISSIHSVGFSSDSKKIFVTSYEGELKFWNINDFDENIKRGYEILNGYELSQEDKEKYYLE